MPSASATAPSGWAPSPPCSPPCPSSSRSTALMRPDPLCLYDPDRPPAGGWQIRDDTNVVGLFCGVSWGIERPNSDIIEPKDRRLAPTRICHESRNSPELSYDYGRNDRRHRVPDALHLGQGRRQAAPRYRSQVAPGLGRRRPADPRPRRPRLPVPEEVFRLPQEGWLDSSARPFGRGERRPCAPRGGVLVLAPSFRGGPQDRTMVR